MKRLLERYIAKTNAASSIEYGLIAAGIAIAISVSVFFLGESVSEFFDLLPGLIG